MGGQGTRGLAIALLGAGIVFALLLVGHSKRAGATFPGKNGLIAFSRTVDDPDGNGFCSAIFSTGVSGKTLRQLTADGGGCPTDVSPSWSADGKRITFARYLSTKSGIYTVTKRGEDLEQVTRPGLDREPSWSPDGKRLVFSRGELGKASIFTIRRNGSDLIRVTPASADFGAMAPVYAPDGEFILFATVGSPEGQALRMVRPDGSDLRAIPTPGQELLTPDWAPDGNRIVFSKRAGSPERFELFTVRPDGTGLEQITEPVHGQAVTPSWSPDGSRITYQRKFFLWRIAADGGEPKRILKPKASEPSWQPN